MNKRSIGVVVSWVLLIGFAIALAVSIFTWSKGQAEQLTDQTVTYVEGKLDCTSVSINVASINDCSLIRIVNKGQLKIEKAGVRIFTDNNLEGDILNNNELMPFEEVENYVGFSGNKVEVIPIIKVNKKLLGCVDKKIIKDCDSSSTGNFDDSLALLLNLNGNADDSSGNQNSGNIIGTDCNVEGKYDKGCSFDGINGRIEIIHSSSLEFTEFTSEAWIKRQLRSGAAGILVLDRSNPNSRAFRYRIQPNGNLWLLIAGGGSYDILSGGNVPLDQWTHVAVVGKSGQYMKLYINGVEVASTTTTQIIDPAIGNTWIGTSWFSASETFNGTIDGVIIYNRTLSPDEILGHYGG